MTSSLIPSTTDVVLNTIHDNNNINDSTSEKKSTEYNSGVRQDSQQQQTAALLTPSTPSNNEVSEAQSMLQNLWTNQLAIVHKMDVADFKVQDLPLARIKKIMKMDEDVKMISAEAPLIFAKAAQLFISELTLRAWIHTEESKRRTLQRNDIATAITKFDQFDFLIDIVPREEMKPASIPTRRDDQGNNPLQYFYTLPTQQLNNSTNVTSQQISNNNITTNQQTTTTTPQVLQLTTSNDNTSQHQQAVNQIQQSTTTTQLNNSGGVIGLLGNSQHQQRSQSVVSQQQTTERSTSTPVITQEALSRLIANSGLNVSEIQSIQISPDGQMQLITKNNTNNNNDSRVDDFS